LLLINFAFYIKEKDFNEVNILDEWDIFAIDSLLVVWKVFVLISKNSFVHKKIK